MKRKWQESISCPDGTIIEIYLREDDCTCFSRGGVTQVCSYPFDRATSRHLVTFSDHNLHTLKLVIEKIEDQDLEMMKLCGILGTE